MTVLNFPTPTYQGQTFFAQNGITYTWDGEKWIVEGSQFGANTYILPPATNSRLGGVTVGTNINVDLNGVISIPNQTQADWNETDSTHIDYIKNKPTDLGAFTNTAGYALLTDLTWNNITSAPNFAVLPTSTAGYLYNNGTGTLSWNTPSGGANSVNVWQSGITYTSGTVVYDPYDHKFYYAIRDTSGYPPNYPGNPDWTAVSGNGNANTGDLQFGMNAMYDLNGVIVENADLSHQATSAVIVPANGTSDPLQLNNSYGPVNITSGTDSGHLKTWTFGADGGLTLPNGAAISSTIIGFNQTFSTNGAGQNSSDTNSLTVGIANPDWAAAILANPSNYYIRFGFDDYINQFPISGISGPALNTNIYTLTGTWTADGGAFPITISSYDYIDGVTTLSSISGAQIATAGGAFIFGTDGVLTMPDGNLGGNGAINFTWEGNNWASISSSESTLNLYSLSVVNGNPKTNVRIGDNVELTTNLLDSTYTWTFGTDGVTSIPDNSYIKAQRWGSISLKSDNADIVIMTDVDNSRGWTFGGAGTSLTLPDGGTVKETQFVSGGGIGGADLQGTLVLTPNGVYNPWNNLTIYNTAFDPETQHIHLASGDLNRTEIVLGNDNKFVKVNLDGSICVQSSAYYFEGAVAFEFQNDGTNITEMEFSLGLYPRLYYVAVGDIITDVSNGHTATITGVDNIINLSITCSIPMDTAGTSTLGYSFSKPWSTGGLWQFGTDGTLTLPNGTLIGSLEGSAGIFGPNGTDFLINTRFDNTGSYQAWTFGTDGSLTFPDASVQTTAYTGIIPNGTKASTDAGTAGQISYDASYIYICTATNTWKRAALTGGY